MGLGRSRAAKTAVEGVNAAAPDVRPIEIAQDEIASEAPFAGVNPDESGPPASATSHVDRLNSVKRDFEAADQWSNDRKEPVD
jgi:hypothetical protein